MATLVRAPTPPPCTSSLPTGPLPPHRAMAAYGRYLKAKAGKPPAGYVTTYTVAGAPDKVRRARTPSRPATHVRSRVMSLA